MLLKAWLQQYRLPCTVFVLLFSVALSLGVALMAQERALKQSSANVADHFELIIGAPGAKVDLILNTVFLQPGLLKTLPSSIWQSLFDEQRLQWFAPIVLGDSYRGLPIIGTTQALIDSLYGKQPPFAQIHNAHVGNNVNLTIGEEFHPQHGQHDDAHEHHLHYQVQGRLPATGTPWDNAILVPVEATWDIHGLGDGHHGHQHEAQTLGEFDHHDNVKPVSAFVLKPRSIAAAYGLRSDFNTQQSQAVFPAEVMVMLYALMGDARALMSYITLICELLVMLALVFSSVALFALFKREFAILRTIGATRGYLLLSVWLFMFTLMGAGTLLGLLLAHIEVQWISDLLSTQVQFVINAELALQDHLFAGTLLLIASACALLPALLVYHMSNERLMQSI